MISDLNKPTGWLVYAENWMADLTDRFIAKTTSVTIPETFQEPFVFLRFAQGGVTPSTARLAIRNVVVTSSTGIASKADATAVNDLATRVTDVEGKATAQATQISGLDSRVDDAASAIDGLNETVAENGLAMANGFQQLRAQVGDVQSSITSTGKAVADLESATAEQLDTMSASVGDLSSAIETQEKTVAGIDGKLSSLYSLKVETNNGKEVVAGISLGSDGETSDIILYADRFSLYNSVSGDAVPVMIAEGNELYIDTTHIKDGSITNAKISGLLASDNFDPDSAGWGINKNGDCVFSNGTFRGHMEAASGSFSNVTIDESCTIKRLYAENLYGDIVTATDSVDVVFGNKNETASGTRYPVATITGAPFPRVLCFLGTTTLSTVWRQNVTIRMDETTIWQRDTGNDGANLEMGNFVLRIPASGYDATHAITIQFPDRGDSGFLAFKGVMMLYKESGQIILP